MEKRYKRLLLKLSGEYLGGENGVGFDFDVIQKLVDQIKEIKASGHEVAIVLGGGNFFRGTNSIPMKFDRVAADQIGMMATIMNAQCLKEALVCNGIKARVLSGLRVPSVAKTFIKASAIHFLEKGEIVILAGGTGNPFFSTDTAAVLRALEIEADIVIKGTKVDGVYDRDPVKDAEAVKYEHLSYSEVLEKDLKVMDGAAIALCRDNNLPLYVLSLEAEKDLMKFLSGDSVGTMVHA